MLSSRRCINITPACVKELNDFEQAFWEKAREYDTSFETYSVCKYPMNEAEMPEHFNAREVAEMKRLANMKYDTRIEQYNRGEKQWDTNVSIIMVIQGTK